MAGKLADRIRSERSRQFVGRAEELALFRSIVEQDQMPIVVLSVSGPGGVGKTTLLRQFEGICAELGIAATTLDGRYLQPNPEFFGGALCMATQSSSLPDALAAVAKNGKGVLFVDTFEAIEPLDGWLRDFFVPELPDNTLVVLLGRKRPTARWRSDVWQTMCRSITLRNLSDADARKYLDTQTVPSTAHEQILSLTHGYPLALSLVAENYAQTGSIGLKRETSPDIVSVLLERFLESVEEPVQRDLLEICSLVRMTSEGLIAEVLEAERASELFSWLKSLSFFEITPFGLMPHDLAREAIATELRWRNPDRYSDLHHRVRRYYADRMERATGPTQQLILFDYIYLHRDNPMIEPFFQWHAHAAAFTDVARPEDLPEILRMIERHEGPESARWAKKWFEEQPSAFLVMRDSVDASKIRGLLAMPDIAAGKVAKEDPATARALNYVDSTAPLRPGERATYFRFWMAEDEYQDVTPIQSMIFVSIVQHYLTEPAPAVTFLPCAAPEFWAPMFQYALHRQLEPLGFEIGGQTFGAYFCDWRVLPPKPWLVLLSEQEVPIKAQRERPQHLGDIVVLSQESFEESVADALKSFTNPAKLGKNPLLRSRLVADRSVGEADLKARIAILKELIQSASESLRAGPKDEKLYQAVDTSYFHPLRSQETAAEKVDVSIATYRRHLKAGVSRIAELLWQQETGA